MTTFFIIAVTAVVSIVLYRVAVWFWWFYNDRGN